ncbi:hypothetical protein LWI29_029657 [Acer saccharum]|uniref:Myb-like domain-containing protein n=1 Tax=Acer saccharum TaxID=4024 RepID=A0AA39SFB0_ACESA|nr:hypothetical protein LWI29_029657 [Acer saccharum]
MEFLDEDARPRFLLQSRPQSSSLDNNHQKLSKFTLFFSISISFFLLFLSFFFLQTEPFQSLLFWLSLSILVGPFAPPHLTAGHIRVGHGPILENPVQDPQIELDTKKKQHKNRSLINKSQDFIASPVPTNENANGSTGFVSKDKKNEFAGRKENPIVKNGEEKEWNEEDIEILKKQMVKNPVGKPKRWEVIAEAFNGRHRVESVIKKSKQLGEKKMDDSDSYAQFLKNRKASDVRIQDTNEEAVVIENKEWSAGEDIALLNALKTFNKDVAMRWEKIAAAVPGKSKAACIKRVSDLKKDFRTSKAGAILERCLLRLIGEYDLIKQSTDQQFTATCEKSSGYGYRQRACNALEV